MLFLLRPALLKAKGRQWEPVNGGDPLNCSPMTMQKAITRKPTESLHVSHDVVVTLLGISGNRVRLGIEAPPEIAIHRVELLELPAVGEIAATEAQLGVPATAQG
jgi:carbon storage regulator